VGELPRPIGTEVAVQNGIAVGDGPVIHPVDDGGSDELVVLAPSVTLLDRGDRRRRVEVGDAVDDGVVSLLRPLQRLSRSMAK